MRLAAVATGLRIYIRFGGWLILPIVFMAAEWRVKPLLLFVVLAFAYAIGTDYSGLPDGVKPARLLDVIP